jgi:DNA adenine methylase
MSQSVVLPLLPNTVNDHLRLRDSCARASKRGARVILSNSKSPVVKEIYSGFSTKTVTARRFINCKGDGRGEVKELLILFG